MKKKAGILLIIIIALAAGAYILLPKRQVNNLVERTKSQVREVVAPIVKPQATLPPSPTAKVLTGGYQTFQTFNNCGPASLSMTLRYFGVNKSQHELGDELRPYQVASGDNDDKSTTLPELARKAQELGFVAYNRPGGNYELIKQFISSGIPVITRTWLHKDDFIGHYRVVKGYDDGKGVIIQDDSFEGANLEYTYGEFDELWEAFNFEYLVIVRPEQKDLAEQIMGENASESVAWENSLKLSESALGKNPNNMYAHFNASVAYYHLGEYEDAVKSYEKTLSGNLPFRMLWYQIEPILAYQKLKKYDTVFSMTNKLIDGGNRAFSEAYQIRGEIYQDQGKTAEANAEFEKVKQYNKNFVKYWE